MMLQIKKWIAVKSDKISFLCLKNLVGLIWKTLSGRPCFCAQQPLMMQNGWKSNQDLQFAREMHSSNTTMLDITVLTEYSFILEIWDPGSFVAANNAKGWHDVG